MLCCSNHEEEDPKHEGHDLSHKGHDSSHCGHGKMMWLMMLLCLAPVWLVFFIDVKISKGLIFLILAACIGGHLVLMSLMSKK